MKRQRSSKIQTAYMLAGVSAGMAFAAIAVAQSGPIGIPKEQVTVFTQPDVAVEPVPVLSLAATINTSPQFNRFSEALRAAGMQQALFVGRFTVLAPNNAAFDQLPEGEYNRLMNDPDTLRAILLNHIIEHPIASQTLEIEDSVRTMAGNTLPRSGRGTDMMVGDGVIVLRDIQTENGVIHVVDSLLIPEEPRFAGLRDSMLPAAQDAARASAVARQELPQTGQSSAAIATTRNDGLNSVSTSSSGTVIVPGGRAGIIDARARRGQDNGFNFRLGERNEVQSARFWTGPAAPMTLDEIDEQAGTTTKPLIQDEAASLESEQLPQIRRNYESEDTTGEETRSVYTKPGAATNFTSPGDVDVAPPPSSLNDTNLPTRGIDVPPEAVLGGYGRTYGTGGYYSTPGTGYYENTPGARIGTGQIGDRNYNTPGEGIGTGYRNPTRVDSPTGSAVRTEQNPRTRSATGESDPGGAAEARGGGVPPAYAVAQADKAKEEQPQSSRQEQQPIVEPGIVRAGPAPGDADLSQTYVETPKVEAGSGAIGTPGTTAQNPASTNPTAAPGRVFQTPNCEMGSTRGAQVGQPSTPNVTTPSGETETAGNKDTRSSRAVTGAVSSGESTPSSADTRASALTGREGQEAPIGIGSPIMGEPVDPMAAVMSQSEAVAEAGLWERPMSEMSVGQVALSQEFSDFAALVREAGMQNLLEDLRGKTLLIPSQTAFRMTPQAILQEIRTDREVLRRIIRYHVVEGELTRAEIAHMKELRTVEGSPIPVSALDIGIRIGPARIEHSDLKVQNGMIQVIDRLLVPAN